MVTNTIAEERIIFLMKAVDDAFVYLKSDNLEVVTMARKDFAKEIERLSLNITVDDIFEKAEQLMSLYDMLQSKKSEFVAGVILGF